MLGQGWEAGTPRITALTGEDEGCSRSQVPWKVLRASRPIVDPAGKVHCQLALGQRCTWLRALGGATRKGRCCGQAFADTCQLYWELLLVAPVSQVALRPSGYLLAECEAACCKTWKADLRQLTKLPWEGLA